MTEKALADKLSQLQNEREAKLNKAANIRNTVKINKQIKNLITKVMRENGLGFSE